MLNRLLAFLIPDPDAEIADLRDQVVKLTEDNRRLRAHYQQARDDRDRALQWVKTNGEIQKRQHRQLLELRQFLAALTPAQMPEVKR